MSKYVDLIFHAIIASNPTKEQLDKALILFATVTQHLVCHMAKQADQNDAGIRALYDAWADMAVDEFLERADYVPRKPN